MSSDRRMRVFIVMFDRPCHRGSVECRIYAATVGVARLVAERIHPDAKVRGVREP